jgi:hypothetical protein
MLADDLLSGADAAARLSASELRALIEEGVDPSVA